MANTTTKASIIINLELSPNEAVYLKGMLQNGSPDESPQHHEMRGEIFSALPSFNDLGHHCRLSGGSLTRIERENPPQ